MRSWIVGLSVAACILSFSATVMLIRTSPSDSFARAARWKDYTQSPPDPSKAMSLQEEAPANLVKALPLKPVAPANPWKAISVKAVALSNPIKYSKYQCSSLEAVSKGQDHNGGAYKYCRDPVIFATTRDGKPCLVYSVGIADNYKFDEAMARAGCEVHSFDPTTPQYPTKLVEVEGFPGAEFHLWGVKAPGLKIDPCNYGKKRKYGGLDPAAELLDLDEIASRLGHENRTIDILKIDCEGCEWYAFSRSPNFLKRVKQVMIELHFSKTLGVPTAASLPLLGTLYDEFLGAPGWRLIEMTSNSGCRPDREVIQELTEAGYGRGCCRELHLVRHVEPRPILSGPRQCKTCETLGPTSLCAFEDDFKYTGQILVNCAKVHKQCGGIGGVKQLPKVAVPHVVGDRLPWSHELVSTMRELARKRADISPQVYPAAVPDLYAALDAYDLSGKNVLVAGAMSPWVEVIIETYRPKSLTTSDYNIKASPTNLTRFIDARALACHKDEFDAISSFSSIEHDGLGRYCDPINPDGDLAAVHEFYEVLRPHGLLFIGFPINGCNRTETYIESNTHRVYGTGRFWQIFTDFEFKRTVDQVWSWTSGSKRQDCRNWRNQPWHILETKKRTVK